MLTKILFFLIKKIILCKNIAGTFPHIHSQKQIKKIRRYFQKYIYTIHK